MLLWIRNFNDFDELRSVRTLFVWSSGTWQTHRVTFLKACIRTSLWDVIWQASKQLQLKFICEYCRSSWTSVEQKLSRLFKIRIWNPLKTWAPAWEPPEISKRTFGLGQSEQAACPAALVSMCSPAVGSGENTTPRVLGTVRNHCVPFASEQVDLQF